MTSGSFDFSALRRVVRLRADSFDEFVERYCPFSPFESWPAVVAFVDGESVPIEGIEKPQEGVAQERFG